MKIRSLFLGVTLVSTMTLFTGCDGGSGGDSNGGTPPNSLPGVTNGKNITTVDLSDIENGFKITTSVGKMSESHLLGPDGNKSKEIFTVWHGVSEVGGDYRVLLVPSTEKGVFSTECLVSERTGRFVDFECASENEFAHEDGKKVRLRIYNDKEYYVYQYEESQDSNYSVLTSVAPFPKL